VPLLLLVSRGFTTAIPMAALPSARKAKNSGPKLGSRDLIYRATSPASKSSLAAPAELAQAFSMLKSPEDAINISSSELFDGNYFTLSELQSNHR